MAQAHLRIGLHHLTRYTFDRPVALSPHEIRLRPSPHSRTAILSYRLEVAPASHRVHWLQDPHGNHVARFIFAEPARSLEVAVTMTADLVPVNPFDFFIEPSAEHFPFDYDPLLREELAAFLRPEPAGPLVGGQLARLREEIAKGPVPTTRFLVTLNQAVARDVAYEIRMEAGVQTPEQTLGLARGSCRDSTWLLVQLLRHLGLGARFVSGYLVQLQRPPGATAGPEADAGALHAWAEVYLPGAGWLGLDPTSGLFAAEGHIPLAATASPAAAAPVIGTAEPGDVQLHHAIQVSRVPQ
jgi:transglutaminase-like putative cysteine protease